jgi:hypothetical protein
MQLAINNLVSNGAISELLTSPDIVCADTVHLII